MLASKWRILSGTFLVLGLAYPVFCQESVPKGRVIGQRLDKLGHSVDKITKSVDDLGDSLFGPIFGGDAKSENRVERPQHKPLSLFGEADAVTAPPPRGVSSETSAAGRAEASSESRGADKPIAPPLYMRFKQYRNSPFDTSQPKPQKRKSKETIDLIGDALAADHSPSERPSDASRKSSLTPLSEEAGVSQPRPAPTGGQPTPAVGRPSPVTDQPTPARHPPSESNLPSRPTPAERPSRVPAVMPVSPETVPEPVAEDRREPPMLSVQKSPPPSAVDENVLIARRGPMLSVETLGPRKIVVGKQSTYEVTMINSGEVAAEGLTVFVSLPEWAEVQGAEASLGAAQVTPPDRPAAPLAWQLTELPAKTREKLVLRIIPRQSRPFDLAVRWEYKPVASQAMIEVQEPKLEMQLDGPREVLYGRKELYRLKLANTGNGVAEGVVIKLLPVGAGENVPAEYPLGALPAGEAKTIEVELTARQAGDLKIQVEARGETGVHAELSEKVLVRRGGLDVMVEGPQRQFVGATATYIVCVKNPGNAPTRNIAFSAVLPKALRYVGGIDGARSDRTGGEVQWLLGTLNPQTERTFHLKCTLGAAGVSRLKISASAEDDLTVAAAAVTRVEAVASLELDVKDPGGPVPVGEEAEYTISVRNRGTKKAENVEVIGYFSRGIEPIRGEGNPHRISSGQILFSPIPVVAPGTETVLTIHAKAETPGNHVFRAEVHCKTLGTRLVNEENTLYYQETATGESGPTAPPGGQMATAPSAPTNR
ncbi:MAG: hypothetical protein JXB10_03390 [Pirellulales bacterium]|nr:hypothetical protein [Pirellulales bacterium]